MTVLIAGATGGFGSVLGKVLLDEGHTVYGTSRNPSSDTHEHGFRLIPMTVTDDASVQACVDEVAKRAGRIDVVVNCINEMIIGTIEEETIEEVRHLYDTNVLGMLRLSKAVIPVMRSQGGGTIVNMSSMGGLIAVPYMSAYTSSKFALEAMTEALSYEVRNDGIDVVIMQPVAMHMDRPATGSHLRLVENVDAMSPSRRMVDRMEKDTAASKLTPELVARQVCAVIKKDKKPIRIAMDRAKQVTYIKRFAPRVVNRMLNGLVRSLQEPAKRAG